MKDRLDKMMQMEPVTPNPMPSPMPAAESKKPRYATVRHPSIEAAVKALYRFEREAQAAGRLASIAHSFILSRKHMPATIEGEEAPLKEIILWVRGFHLKEADEKKGALGHFARIHIHELQDGRYTLKAEKIEVEIKNHPQKKRLPSKHPNWGHPVLRSVIKERPYATVAEATAAMQMLHEEYPEVSIPTGNKLYIITYSKPEPGAKPVQKVVLELKLNADGTCLITAQQNDKPFLPKEAQPKMVEGGGTLPEDALLAQPDNQGAKVKEPREQKGYYTGMVELRRNKKKRVQKPMPPKPAEE